jgi:hypothetical protein
MHRHEPTCSADCRYRGLYEGAMTSLADLNDKLRATAGRHGRLRGNLISAMKRAFPQQFLAAERSERRRMADQSDEVLLRYLGLWLSGRPDAATQPAPGIGELRTALATAGVVLPPGDDLSGWARAVRDQQERVLRAEPAPDTSDRELIGIFDEHLEPKVVSRGESGPVGPGPVTPFHPSAADDLLSIFTEAPGPLSVPTVPLTDAQGNRDGRDGRDRRRSGKRRDDDPSGQTPRPASSEQARGDRNSATNLAEGRSQRAQQASGKGGKQPANRDQKRQEGKADGQGTKATDLRDGRQGGAPAVNQAPEARPERQAPAPVQEPTQAQETTTPDPSPSPPEVAPAGSNDAATPTSRAMAGPALRPQIFPQTSTRKTRRRGGRAAESGVSASAPGPMLDIPQSSDPSGEVPETLYAKALELVKRPTPVFASDLVLLGLGSEEEVAAWEQACRADRSSPVRFVGGKQRHQARGALVLPYAYEKEAPAEFTRSVWAQALRLYRGGQLYEIAVLLHRTGADLISADLDDGLATLRLQQPRGTVGLVAVLGTDLGRGGADRQRLDQAVEKMLATPLTLLVVTTTVANSLADVTTALVESARERDWNPTYPVICQRSWEYAEDRGSTATLVLGG